MHALQNRRTRMWTLLLLMLVAAGCQQPAASPVPPTPTEAPPAMPSPTWTPTAPVAPSPTPEPMSPPASTAARKARELVLAYYTALGARDFAQAHALLSPEVREGLPLPAFQERHADVVEVGIQGQTLGQVGEDKAEVTTTAIVLRRSGDVLVQEKWEVAWLAAREGESWYLHPLEETLLGREERELDPPLAVLREFYGALHQHQFRVAYALGSRGFRAAQPYTEFVETYNPVVEIVLEYVKYLEEGPAEARVFCRVRARRVEDLDLVTRLWGITWTLRLENGAWRLHQADGRVMAQWREPVAWLEVPVVRFYAALDRGEPEAAYALLYEGRKALLPLEEFKEQYARYRAIKMTKFRTLEVAGLEARVLVGLEVEEAQDDGTTVTMYREVEWKLRRVGNTWRLDESELVSERRR
ncbi:MAG: hypothetical protein H5T59_01705 [Anaerolineae bacterium]|nr:hypothetical protein [Anaerolineae bacterium]